ncbi:hypothetical protein [Marinicauda sp. Alg238-R41]|uniref:hypothetical protein n=1 Tax=Marinicauda sp. Alg238-R41 TaxID=2993447 RepID=UPI0022E572EE|nr:hypothetical protein [Marinicauda sp. Alg238-R41]
MSDQSNNARPSHRLFTVTGDGENARWTEIGAAWSNKDGKGFNLALEALPVNGRLVMRSIEPKGAQGGQS